MFSGPALRTIQTLQGAGSTYNVNGCLVPSAGLYPHTFPVYIILNQLLYLPYSSGGIITPRGLLDSMGPLVYVDFKSINGFSEEETTKRDCPIS